MELGSLIELFLSSELEKYLFNRKDLKVGEKLLGRVIEIKENGNTLIDFSKFRTIAKVKFPLKVGEKISVRVIEKGENLKFALERNDESLNIKAKELLNNLKTNETVNIKKLISELNEFIADEIETTKISDKSKEIPKKNSFEKINLPKNRKNLKSGDVNIKEIKNKSDFKFTKDFKIPTKIKNIIKNINNQFEPVKPSENLLKIITVFKNQIENSGIFFENKIASVLEKVLNKTYTSDINLKNDIKSILKNDLKPNLLILKEFFNDIDENISKNGIKKITVIKQTVDELILNIGKQQENAIKKSGNPDTIQYFTFQIPLKSKKNAKLRVYYNKKDKNNGSKGGFNLSLLLSMDNLGDIRTDFLLLKNDLNITFFVSEDTIKKVISERLNEIKNILNESFRFLNINVLVSKRKIRDFDNEEIINEYSNEGFVDLRV